jgi:hypothetical protein
MNTLFETATKQAEAATGAVAADIEAAKIGAAAERKRREEAELSLNAVLASDGANGKGVMWERRIRANGEVRHVAMIERAGAYTERGLLAACNRAARQAGKGRLKWDGEAVDSIAAELCLSILAKTHGRMPRKGHISPQTKVGNGEDPDAAYLTASAARLIAQALKGESRAAGLAAEIAPMAAAEGATYATGADLLAAAVDGAEGESDAYLMSTAPLGIGRNPSTWSDADWCAAEALARQAESPLTTDARWAIGNVARLIGKRPAAVEAALVAALRQSGQGTGGVDQAADLAAAGFSKSSGAFRKAAHTGRDILRAVWSYIPETAEHAAELEEIAAALETLSAADTAERESKHLGEANGPGRKQGARLTWPDRKPPRADTYTDRDGNAQPVPTRD